MQALGGVFDEPYAINDAGQIVGSSRMPDIGETHLVLWQNGTTTDLGTLGGLTATGVDINEKGQIVGTSDNGADDQWSHAFLWQGTTGMVDLGPWGGSNYGAAIAVNNQSQVVGWGFTLDGWWRAFLWRSGRGMTDLGMLPNAISSRPNAINDQGQIVGVNLVATGDWHAVLWAIVRPLTPAEQIGALTDAVNNLAAAGKLKRGNAQSVLTKLDNAARQLTHGHENVAAQMLGQFVQKVAELVAGGTLSSSDGQSLIDAAQKLINELTT
jgi:probable HAF family extracellular repeat protein